MYNIYLNEILKSIIRRGILKNGKKNKNIVQTVLYDKIFFCNLLL